MSCDTGSLRRGARVRISGLQARPELNEVVGRLLRFVPEKDRWAVQLESSDGSAPSESVLIRPGNLRCEGGALDAPPVFARSLTLAGRSVQLFGIQSYAGSKGGDEIFENVDELRPGVVVMESFAADDVSIDPGDSVPYRRLLSGQGLDRALDNMESSDFRQAWSAESIAVLAALRVGAEVRLGDRLHVTSFDRLIARHGLDELRHALIDATESLATWLEERQAAGGASVAVTLQDLPQNMICPLFKELSSERHLLMAHFVRLAVEEGHNVAVVIGAEHIGPVADLLLQDPPQQVHVQELLQEGAASEEPWQAELEKRAAVSAFLSSTCTFPSELVLPSKEQLLPEAGDFVAKVLPKYRTAFAGRLAEAVGGDQQALSSRLGRAPRARGLHELLEFCIKES
ncbi:unnamed protein product [Polarella glacialis]|uniref:Uncharacterized protein n=1 Tax=Polarella glacialis TaxID=89957 RepID=A0A813LRG0_POLGL|nr:unnamed protein product [Polarella glacialis]